MRVSRVELQRTVFEPSQFTPVDLPQVAVVGRSNVGKSSLINALVERKELAHVSKMPGRTASINYYYLKLKETPESYNEFFLVDLPGYGFARTGRDERNRWGTLVNAYFASEFAPQALLVLLDIRREVEDDDLWFFEQSQAESISVVLTKSDKCTRNEGKQIRAKRALELGVPEECVFLTSRIDSELDEVPQLRDYLGTNFGQPIITEFS